MTDIVERLHTQPEDPLDLGTLLWEAADTIERLRDDRRMLLLCEGDRKEMADAIKRLRITVNDQAATITKLFEEMVHLQERLKRATTS